MLLVIGLAMSCGVSIWLVLRHQRLDADRMKRSNERSRVLAHYSTDVRDRVNAAVGFCDLLEPEATDPHLRQQVDGIRANLDGLLRLISDGLIYFGGEHLGQRDSVSFPAEIRSGLATYSQRAAAKGLHFELHVEPGSPDRVEVDRALLRHVVGNVVAHAVAITVRGHVEITLQAVPDRALFALVAVADTGPALSAETRALQFAPYGLQGHVTGGNPTGTGLHLAVARQLVEQAGGSLVCEASPNGGTVYIVHVPVTVQSRLESGETAHPQSDNVVKFRDLYVEHRARVAPRRVLVAEDHLANQHVIRSTLERAGHSVVVVTSGDAALDLLSSESFDVAIVDLRLPGASGLDIIRVSRLTDARHIPFVVLTAEVSERTRNESYAAGAWAYLTKPVSAQQLLDTLRAVCERAEQLSESAPGQATMDVGPLHSPIALSIANGAPSHVVIENFRYALRYVAELEHAAGHSEKQLMLVRALRGVAHMLDAKDVASVCIRMLKLPPDERELRWHGLYRELVDSVDRARRDTSKLFGTALLR